MNAARHDLRKRTRDYALRIVKLYAALPNGTVAQVLGKQVSEPRAVATGSWGTFRNRADFLIRSLPLAVLTQIYREACRAKSNADFINKIEGALQELDETQ